MLTEERFQHRAPVDKRGRKVRGAPPAADSPFMAVIAAIHDTGWPVQVKLERKNEDLAQYYQLQGEVSHAVHAADSR